MSDPLLTLDLHERTALRRVAQLCWLARDKLGLSEADREAALISCMAVGADKEREAAAEVLHALREQAAKQKHFDGIIRDEARPHETP